MKTHEEMRDAARAMLDGMDDALRTVACRPFDDEVARRWIEYRPEPRPGASLAEMELPTRKAAHRLLATALSRHAYAQAMAIMALEEVLDRAEGWERGRHSDDYTVVVLGDPAHDDPWGWRFEGHHVSVSMTLDGDRVSPMPLFLGANPARVRYRNVDVLRPLMLEEELARSLLEAMTEAERSVAVLSDIAPSDILSERQTRVPGPIEPLGVAVRQVSRPAARDLLGRLVDVYVERLPAALAQPQVLGIDRDALTFAWAGSVDRGAGHYYRIQAPDLLIEYDNTQNDANHIHSVMRRPVSDFGADLLRAHRAEAHQGRR